MSTVRELSFAASLGGTSQKVALSTTSAQSTAIGSGQSGTVMCLVTLDADGFYRQGSNPTALSDGTDQILLANNTYRIPLVAGNKFAFILASGTGSAYITPEL